MRSLTVKITAVLLLVSLIAVGMVGVLTRRATVTRFDQFIVERQQQQIAETLGAAYEETGSWMAARRALGMRGQGMQQQPGAQLVVVDAEGRAVTGGGPVRRGDRVPQGRGTWEPVTAGGETVGYVVNVGGSPELNPAERRFLQRINRAVFLATLGAGGVALVVGLVLTAGVMRPLRDLTAAIRRMRAGELAQRVEVRSRDEIGELVSAFNTMSADLAHANALRKQMTADVAHELRTPLTVLIGYLEGMRDGVLPPNTARFETMHREALQLQHLVEDLRTLTLADSGEMRLDLRPLTPAELLRGVGQSFAALAEAEGVTLSVQADDDLPPARADFERMTQVLSNITANALRHTPAGGRVTLSAVRHGDGVRFTVRDTGEGIPPEKLPHIFERFYRADDARTDSGTGLGLAIARSIVEAHGGRITASSTPGQGTVMVVDLPTG
jgi:signal transduction histidine kinase